MHVNTDGNLKASCFSGLIEYINKMYSSSLTEWSVVLQDSLRAELDGCRRELQRVESRLHASQSVTSLCFILDFRSVFDYCMVRDNCEG